MYRGGRLPKNIFYSQLVGLSTEIPEAYHKVRKTPEKIGLFQAFIQVEPANTAARFQKKGGERR